MSKFRRWFLPVAIVSLLLVTLIGGSCAPQSLGEALDPSGNPFAHRFTDVKDIRAATYVVAASDSEHRYEADYFCDGTNDHVQIQAAIDALPDTGGEVLLLDGTYYVEVSLVLDSFQTLRGCGWNTILTTTTTNLDVITATGGDGMEKVGITIADLCVEGNAGGVTNDLGISWAYVDYSSIYNVLSLSNGERGIRTTESNHNRINGNTCLGNASDGIQVSGTYNIVIGNVCQENDANGISVGENHNTIINNTCQGNSDEGIRVDGPYHTLTGNICNENGGVGIKIIDYSSNNTIINNTCQGNGERGISFASCHNTIIIGNTCVENSQSADNTYDNIYVTSSDYCNIQGNTCRAGGETNKPRYGININNAACDKNLVVGNDLYDDGFGTAPFNDAGTGTIVTDTNRGITPVQVKHLIYVQNTSGGNLLTGNVVKYNAAAGSVGFTTPTAVGDNGVWGMLVEDIDNNASGYIQVLGGTTLLDATNAGGAISIGDFLCAEIGVRARLAAAGEMVFAIALEDCDAVDRVIDALIIVPRKM